jgi:hypothetical protein
LGIIILAFVSSGKFTGLTTWREARSALTKCYALPVESVLRQL